MAAAGEEDLAAEFGAWLDGEDAEGTDGEAESGAGSGSGDEAGASNAGEDAEEPEGAEKLVGRRARWAPRKGLVVELSAEAASALAGDPAKFFAGPGTIRHVSLDASESHVEWEAKPGTKVAYPTGYRGRFYLRIYAPAPPPAAELTPAPGSKPAGKNTKEKVAELRAMREAERVRRQQHAERMRKKAEREERARQEHARISTPAAGPARRSRSRGSSQRATPATADRHRTEGTPAPKSARTPETGGTERAQEAATRPSRGRRSRGLAPEQQSKHAVIEQPILPLDDIENQARSTIEALTRAEKQLERAASLAPQKDQLLEFLKVGFPKSVEEVNDLARAGNTALARCRNAAVMVKNPAFQHHIAKVRSYFSLADYLCILLRRLRKLVYLQKLAPLPSGELPLVPEWGGKLRIQAEMEITKCVASAILFHKARESRQSAAMPAAGLQASEANAESLKPAEAPKTGKSKGSHRRRSHGKSDAEVNLMNQMWSDPALPGIPGSGSNSPPRQSSPNTLKNQHQAAGATEGPNRDLDDFLNREFVRDVETAQRFINQNDDELFVAARAAANGGAGSLAVLLRTLETQAGHGPFLQGDQVMGNTQSLDLRDARTGRRKAHSWHDTDAPAHAALLEDQTDLKDSESPKVVSALAPQGYEQKWKASGPYPSASPVWGQDAWRGEKQPGQVHGPTRSVGMYKMMKFLKPSKDPASAASFPLIPKTPSSELKAHGLFPRDSKCVVPKTTLIARKQLITGAMHGNAYRQARRALFTPDDLQKQLSSSLTNAEVKVWPPQLSQAAEGTAAGEGDTLANRHKQRRTFQSSLMREMRDTMGPYFDRACVRTPLDGSSRGGRSSGEGMSPGSKLPSSTSPFSGLLTLRQSSRPPTREYQKGLLEQIEGRILAHSRQVRRYVEHDSDMRADDGRGRGPGGAVSVMANASQMDLSKSPAPFERGLTPKLIPEGYRSRSVMGTSDTGWPSRVTRRA